MDDRRNDLPGRRWSDSAIDVLYDQTKLLNPLPTEVSRIATRLDHFSHDLNELDGDVKAILARLDRERERREAAEIAERKDRRRLWVGATVSAVVALIAAAATITAALLG